MEGKIDSYPLIYVQLLLQFVFTKYCLTYICIDMHFCISKIHSVKFFEEEKAI